MPQTEDEDWSAKPESLELILTISLTMTVSCIAIIVAFQEIDTFGRNIYLVSLVFAAASIIGGWTILGSGEISKLLFKEAK
jgi:uncharacterized membrane protein